jgi:hypothetical protein
MFLAFAIGLGLSNAANDVSTAGAKQQMLEKAWSKDLDSVGEGVSPVKRVVTLLNKMKAELEKEADNEAEMYDKMVCWCKTGEKEKTAAIAAADAKDIELSSEIEGRSARGGELAAEITNLKGQIADDTAAYKEARAIREKESASFRDGETDLTQAITNLKNAIAILGRHQGGSFLQLGAPLVSGLEVMLRDLAFKYELLTAGHERSGKTAAAPSFIALATTHGKAVSSGETTEESAEDSVRHSLLNALDVTGVAVSSELPLNMAERLVAQATKQQQVRNHAFLQTAEQQPGMYASYSTRSDGIFGILNQMLEEFEAELKDSIESEGTAKESFKAMEAAKTEQLAVGKEKLDEMEVEASANSKGLSDAKEDLDNTRAQRSADVEYLRNLKTTCNDLDAQWEKRSKTRNAELKAVAETIVILTEDDNREMLAKSVPAAAASFLQTASASTSQLLAKRRAASTSSYLRRAARAPVFDADDLLSAWHGRHRGSPPVGALAGPRAQLSTLAVSVQLDGFEKVKKVMDDLIAEMKKQHEEEVKFKAYCQEEFSGNEKATHAKAVEKKDLETTLDTLAAETAKLNTEIAEAKTNSAETELSIKEASEQREKENAEFQSTVADQRATQSILKKALARLEDFYKKGLGKAALLQAKQEPPVKFNEYKDNAGSSPVMGLLEQIIEDSVTLETEATASETEAQTDYEGFVKKSNDLIASLSEAITTKTKAVATAMAETAEAEASKADAEAELESLAQILSDLHGECDFVVKNFEIRQKARLQEIEAIQGAKGILSGDVETATPPPPTTTWNPLA